MNIWSELINTPWGNATVTTAVFLLWCVCGLALTQWVRRLLQRKTASARWQAFGGMEDRLRWSVLLWIVLTGAAVVLAVAKVLWDRGAVMALERAVLALLVVSVGATSVEAVIRLLGWELRREHTPEPLVRFAQAIAAVVTSFIAALFLLAVVDVDITPLFALGGVALVPVFWGFQDVLANVIAYYRLTRGRRLRAGDLVRLENGVAGHVQEITWQDVRIRTRANNLLAVPNRRFAQLIVTNYHLPEGGTLCSTPVLVTKGPDPEILETILLDELRNATRSILGLVADDEPSVRRGQAQRESGVGFTLFYRLEDPDYREGVEQEILQRMARRFHQEGIEGPLLDLVRSNERRDGQPASAQRLQQLVKERLGDTLLVVASNREPYLHNFDGASIRWSTPVSGMTSALDPVMTVLGGVWVAHGSGSADRELSHETGRVQVPPDCPATPCAASG